MAEGSNGILVLVFVLAIIIGVIQCCLRIFRYEHEPKSRRQTFWGCADNFTEDLLQPGPSEIQFRRRGTSEPKSPRQTFWGCAVPRDDFTDEDLLQPGPSEIQFRRNGTSASPVVVPPYPVDARHPTPQTAPVPGFATHNPPYPMQTPHPVPVGGSAPYPPAGGAPYPPVSGAAPYPPAGPPTGSTVPYPDYSASPPSYSEAVGQPPIQPPPSKEGYSKQSPYNPNY